MPTPPGKSSEDTADMGTKNPTVRMCFIHHDVRQVSEEVRPHRMIVEYGNMQHVRIGQDNPRSTPDGRTFVPVRIAIIYCVRYPPKQVKLRHFLCLVIRQCLGWKQVKCSGIPVSEQMFINRAVVT